MISLVYPIVVEFDTVKDRVKSSQTSLEPLE